MDEAKQRVENELNELSDKVCKLTKFVLSEKFTQLTSGMKSLMLDQLRLMTEYGHILRKRLAIWDKTEEETQEMFCCF